MEIHTHGLEFEKEAIIVRSIDHKNQYDFTRLHRHSYFEVMFFEQGGGKNLIDFVEYEVKSNACYIIYPSQIHLLRRSEDSHGFLIQFQQGTIESRLMQRLLQEKAWSGSSAILFEDDEIAMGQMRQLIHSLESLSRWNARYVRESQQQLLQAILFALFSNVSEKLDQTTLDKAFYQFLQLVDMHFREAQTVRFYLDQMNISEKKLAALAQKFRGITPLQIIHQRILLEAKRLLVEGILAHKEIAYDLGFDSPSSFSAFIKKKTGLTASEIQAQVAEIHF